MIYTLINKVHQHTNMIRLTLFWRPHTWQAWHLLQHQLSEWISWGRSSSSRQNSWKGSQHTLQYNIWINTETPHQNMYWSIHEQALKSYMYGSSFGSKFYMPTYIYTGSLCSSFNQIWPWSWSITLITL